MELWNYGIMELLKIRLVTQCVSQFNFGTTNNNDEDQEECEHRTSQDTPQPPDRTCPKETSLPSRNPRPPPDPKVSEVYRVVDPEVTVPTSRPGSRTGDVQDEELQVPVYRYFSFTGS